jgi:hypothetical protein
LFWLFWRWDLMNHYLCWPWAVIFLISASCVAKIIGGSHQHLATLQVILFCWFLSHCFQLRSTEWLVEWRLSCCVSCIHIPVLPIL